MPADRRRSKLNIRENVPLAPLTTLKIGGAARFFVSAQSDVEVARAVEFAAENSLDFFVLGGGSNVLIADAGFDGLVLQIRLKGVSTAPQNDGTVHVTAAAGEDWDTFVAFCVESNLAGVECLSGIPGFVGGTPVQNVGAYGQEVSETIVSVRVFDTVTKEILELANADCKFTYRASIFNRRETDRFIVLAVTYALQPNGEPKIVYKDLREFFAGRRPSLLETREAVLRIRAAKSMVIDENDPNSKSAGSFFKNPVVSAEKFAAVVAAAKSMGIENVPGFAAGEKSVKMPAAWLIERSGFDKGFRLGKVGISTRHTLAIVNFDGAGARDVLLLKAEIQTRVKNTFGIELEPEPIFVGF